MGRFTCILPEGRQPMYGELIGYEERRPPERRMTCSDCDMAVLLHPESKIMYEQVQDVLVITIEGPDPVCERITERSLNCAHRNFTINESFDRQPVYYGGEPMFPTYYDDVDEQC